MNTLFSRLSNHRSVEDKSKTRGERVQFQKDSHALEPKNMIIILSRPVPLYSTLECGNTSLSTCRLFRRQLTLLVTLGHFGLCFCKNVINLLLNMILSITYNES